ncbi:AAA family ATPase [Oceaniglobus roseus]|uniref:AAA family ATPase n=1 Tax=Oceaniglobus roseus TaxID=1737570 RepID=UPI000C7F2E01|nr:MoxR family ATPase [Kandeliimicrobium roseum]
MSLNAPRVTPGRAAEILAAGWEAQRAGRLTASWMLHGRPGVGKTQVVQDLASRIGADLHDLRLTTIEPQDLRGLPYYDHDARKTVWYRPEDLPEDPDRPAILFLDELTAAAPQLQPTVYGLLQERRVGRHRLPPSVMVIAAGNTVEDGAVAYEMGTALSDRLIHLDLAADPDQWVKGFAVPRGLHPAVTAFIRARPDLLDTTEESLRRGDVIACTPRSWERVSTILAAIPDATLRRAAIAGTVGEAAAAEFAAVAEDIAASLRVDEMLALSQSRRWPLYPVTLNGLNALVFALAALPDRARVGAAVEVMEGIRHLAAHREEAAFARLPLAELCAFGFEMLLARALDLGLGAEVAASPAYAAYAADRQAAGLG